MGDKFAGVPTFTQHTTVTERAAAAAEFVRDYDWTIPMHLDTLENDVVTQLGAWPLRLFIVQDGVLKFMAQPTHEDTYAVSDLRQALEALLSA